MQKLYSLLKRVQRADLKALSMSLLAGCLLAQHLVENLTKEAETIWIYWVLFSQFITVFALLYINESLPYSKLRLKCVIGGLLGLSLADAVAFITAMFYKGFLIGYWNLLSVILLLVFSACYWFRQYADHGIEINDTDLFLMARKPDSTLGYILSMLYVFRPYSGYAWFHNGKIYAYRKGTFQCFDMISDRYVAVAVIKDKDKYIEKLNKSLGTDISMFNNCLTLDKINKGR